MLNQRTVLYQCNLLHDLDHKICRVNKNYISYNSWWGSYCRLDITTCLNYDKYLKLYKLIYR